MSENGAPQADLLAADPVLVEKSAGIVRIILNNPRRKNAMTIQGWTGLRTALESIDTAVDRVVVLQGAGTDFCAGADLSSLDTGQHQLAVMRVVNGAALALYNLPIPCIAQVDGVAVGAGMNIALACDFVIATDRARFSEIFIKRGLSVDFGGSWLLPRLVGLRKAKELVLLGDIISAPEASKLGLLHAMVPVEELSARVQNLAERLLANPPIGASLSKQLLNNSFNVNLSQALEDEARSQTINQNLEDAKEAFSAFLEKREPVFRGR